MLPAGAVDAAAIASIPAMAALAAFALRRRYVTARGAVGGVAVGAATALADLRLLAVLVFFFLTSSFLTRLRAQWKASMGLKDVGGRSLRQVVGVGTPIATFAALYLATGREAFLGAAAVSAAAAAADTWASEVGVAYGGTPRYILAPWRRVEPGVSGGVTAVGVAASAAGAVATALVAWRLGLVSSPALAAALGYLGEVLDSLLGATLQVKYRCGEDIRETPAEGCARSGLLSNEAVNLLAGLAVGLAYAALQPP